MDICHAKFNVVAQYFSNGRKILRSVEITACGDGKTVPELFEASVERYKNDMACFGFTDCTVSLDERCKKPCTVMFCGFIVHPREDDNLFTFFVNLKSYRRIPRKNLLDKTRKKLLKECGADAPADIRICFCTKAGMERVMQEAYRRCTDDSICPPKIPALLSAWD